MRRIFIRRTCRHHQSFGITLSIMALAVIAPYLMPPPAQAGEEQLVKAGAVDRPLLVREHAAWNMDCRAVPYPMLRLERPPRHGAVCARVTDVAIRTMYTGTELQCIGRVVQGLRLIYFPQPGFTGNDRLQYSVQYPSIRRRVSVTVSVGARTGAAMLPLDTVGAVPDTGQPPGPVPFCAASVS
jgi:hypothetical protein